MATPTNKIEEFTVQEFESWWNSLVGVMQDTQFVDDLGEQMDRLEKQHSGYFATGQGPSGDAWGPNAPSTVKRKGHANVLIDTKRLRDSLTSRRGDGAIREIVSEPPNSGLSFGTSVEYSIYHQAGTSSLPKREHVGTTDEALQPLLDDVADSVVEALRRS